MPTTHSCAFEYLFFNYLIFHLNSIKLKQADAIENNFIYVIFKHYFYSINKIILINKILINLHFK